MLDELRIRGLGVIDDAVLPLGPGLTVVTGETGAGKTMVVTGLLLLFGGRADASRVRTGEQAASVDGRLTLASGSPAARRVVDAGGDLDDDRDLVLRRVVNAAGRSRAYAGGAAVPVAVLGELAEHLVAVHGQSDQLRLARPAAQRAALDRFAGVDTGPYSSAYVTWRELARDLADRTGRAAELRREADLLSHGVAEIDEVAPRPGEDLELTALASRLGHADDLGRAARSAHDVLRGAADDPTGEAPDVGSLLGGAARDLAARAGQDPELDALAARLVELDTLAADLGAELGAYSEQLDTDPTRLEQVELRRAALAALVRRYGDGPAPDVAAVLAWAAAARGRLEHLDVSDEALDRLRADVAAAADTAGRLAAEVSRERSAAATRLAAAITTELAGLAMSGAEVAVEVRQRPAAEQAVSLTVDGRSCTAGPDGVDEVEILLAAHPGAPALPLARGASGGELSRVMLALEVSLESGRDADDSTATLVFDEIDAGVGGRAAIEVGRRLARLARDRQVLVVTHLAQVAAFADQHLVVDKPSSGRSGRAGSDPAGVTAGVTASDVRVVTDAERVVELARMLAGSDTITAREHAAELLADARGSRPERAAAG